MNGRAGNGLSTDRVFQAQRPKGQVHEMATKVRQRTTAEVPPIAPFEMGKLRMIRVRLHRPEPQVPIQIRRDRRPILGSIIASIIRGSPNVDLVHAAYGAALNGFDHTPIIVPGMNLSADLRHETRLLRE